MRIVLLTAFILFGVSFCEAQDSIFLRNKSLVLAKVLEIGELTILYKKIENLTGPDYKISINKVKRIVYENGSVEEFEKVRPPVPGRRKPGSSEIAKPEEPSARVANIIKNKMLYPRTLPHNLLAAGYYISNAANYNAPDNKPAHGLYVKYERLLFKELVGVGIAPFVAFNQRQIGAKFNATVYTKFFGKLRIGVGPYYTISSQKFLRTYWVNATLGSSPSGAIYVNDEKATVGSVGFSSVALLHLNKKCLLSFGADIGEAIHINQYKSMPESWEKQPAGEASTLGQFSIGLVRRF